MLGEQTLQPRGRQVRQHRERLGQRGERRGFRRLLNDRRSALAPGPGGSRRSSCWSRVSPIFAVSTIAKCAGIKHRRRDVRRRRRSAGAPANTSGRTRSVSSRLPACDLGERRRRAAACTGARSGAGTSLPSAPLKLSSWMSALDAGGQPVRCSCAPATPSYGRIVRVSDSGTAGSPSTIADVTRSGFSMNSTSRIVAVAPGCTCAPQAQMACASVLAVGDPLVDQVRVVVLVRRQRLEVGLRARQCATRTRPSWPGAR